MSGFDFAEYRRKQRNAELDCAFRFLTEGEPHEESCTWAKRGEGPCSRTYNPGEEPEQSLYEGTGIGALFGWTESRVYELAGWNVSTRLGEGMELVT